MPKKQQGSKKKMAKGRRGPKAARPRAPSARPKPLLQGGWTVPTSVHTRGNQVASLTKAVSDAAMCCGMVNPWHPACEGMKFPDGNNGRSMTTRIKGMFTTFGGANACISFVPTLPFGIMTATYSSSVYTNVSSGTGLTTYNCPSMFTSNANDYRIVCGGLKITVTSGVTVTQGTLTIARNNTIPAFSQTRTAGNLDDEYSEVYAVATGASWIVPFRRSAVPLFQGQSTTGSYNLTGNNPWESITLELNSANASTAVTVEYIFNVEWQYLPGSGYAHIAPRDPQPNPRAIDAASKALNKMPPVVTGTLDKFAEVAEKAAVSAFEKGGEYLLEGLAGLFL